MKAGRLPDDHPQEQLARARLRRKTYRDTPEGRVVSAAEQAIRTAPKRTEPPRRRWGST
jgi:hypothetical protein